MITTVVGLLVSAGVITIAVFAYVRGHGRLRHKPPPDEP